MGEGVSLRASFEVSKLTIPSALSLPTCGSSYEFSAVTASRSAASCHAAWSQWTLTL